MNISRISTGFLSRIVSQASTLALLVLGAQYLTPAEFGNYTIASIAAALANLLLFSGGYEYYLKSEQPARDGPAVLLFLLMAASFASLMLVASGILLNYLSENSQLSTLLQLFAVVPLFAVTASWREASMLRQPDKLSKYFGLITLRDAAALGLGAILLWLGWGLWAMVVHRIALAAFGYVLFLIVHPAIARIGRNFTELLAVAKYSIPLTGSRLLSFFSSNGMDIVVGVFLTPAAVGLYRMASRLILAAYDIVVQPLMKQAWVNLAEDVRRGEAGASTVLRTQAITLILLSAALAYIVATRDTLVVIVLGEKWKEIGPLLPFLAAAALLTGLAQFAEPVLSLRNRTRELLMLRLGVTSTLLLGVAVGSLALALPGAAIGKLGATAFSALIMGWGLVKWGGLSIKTYSAMCSLTVISFFLNWKVATAIGQAELNIVVELLLQGVAIALCAAVAGLMTRRWLKRYVEAGGVVRSDVGAE